MKRFAIMCCAVLAAWTPVLAQEEPSAAVGASVETPAAVVAGEAAVSQEAAPASHDSLWDRANTAYINGDFRAAAEAYEALLADGLISVKLYYNLANACFKEERLGEAILFYRRALRLAPGNGDVRYNLGVAEARTKDNIERIPEFFFVGWMRGVRHTMGGTAWTLLSLFFLAGALALFLLYLLAQRLSLRKTGFYGTLAAAVLFVVTMSFAASSRREMLDRSEAVVMTASVAVKSSPDKSATDLFLLHEGTVVRIADRLGEWCEVVIDDGKKGWLESRKIEVI